MLVSLVSYEYSTASAVRLEACAAANEQQWVNGWKAFATSVVGCVMVSHG